MVRVSRLSSNKPNVCKLESKYTSVLSNTDHCVGGYGLLRGPQGGVCAMFPKKASKIFLIPKIFLLNVPLKELPNHSPESILIPRSLKNLLILPCSN